MITYCGVDCCKVCSKLSECGGCEKCQGHPFGGNCVAERNKNFLTLKNQIIEEINSFGIEDLTLNDFNLLNGAYVNFAYPLPNGTTAQFLNDNDIYFANQIERPNSERFYGVVANEEFILICEYGFNGVNPEIILYKRR